jgi:hypothetical protein
MEDDSTDPAEQAFVAYFATVIGRPVTFESLRNGRIIAEALNHEQVQSFLSYLQAGIAIDIDAPVSSQITAESLNTFHLRSTNPS